MEVPYPSPSLDIARLTDNNTPELELREEYPDLCLESRSSTGGTRVNGAEEEGLLCSTRDLYEGQKQCPCCINWVTEPPEDLPAKIHRRRETSRYALLVRRRKSHSNRKDLAIDSVVIQSPILKQVLADVLKGLEGVAPDMKYLSFSSPFYPLFQRWNRLLEALKHERDAQTKEHIQLLVDALSPEITEACSLKEDFIKNTVVTYEHAWTLFEEDTLVFTSRGGQDRLYELHGFEYSRPLIDNGDFLKLKCSYIDWNGKRLGYASLELKIWNFDGMKPLHDLEVYPALLHPSYPKLVGKLKERGKMWELLKGFNYKTYNGCFLQKDPSGCLVTDMLMEGRVVIDADAYFNRYANEQLTMTSLNRKPKPMSSGISLKEQGHLAPPPPCPPLVPPEYSGLHPGKHTEDIPINSALKSAEQTEQQTLENEHHLLCPPTVRGFCLTNKCWALFYVEKVRDIDWNDEAFASLILPQDYKELILAFAESQIQNKEEFDDIIVGKGQGIIMLLTGEPGVGKTLTAESLAEKMRRPLYIMSMGELGISANSVERSLKSILQLAARWDAILLLDEADVFLEQRSLGDIRRNELVAVFLRLLEYYRGILFLTTNRVQTFDSAFKSRIHLTIRYPKLNRASRERIWRNMVGRLKRGNRLDDEDFDELARLSLNGREIKNIVKTAQLLASRYDATLSIEQIRTVVRITQDDDDAHKRLFL